MRDKTGSSESEEKVCLGRNRPYYEDKVLCKEYWMVNFWVFRMDFLAHDRVQWQVPW